MSLVYNDTSTKAIPLRFRSGSTGRPKTDVVKKKAMEFATHIAVVVAGLVSPRRLRPFFHARAYFFDLSE